MTGCPDSAGPIADAAAGFGAARPYIAARGTLSTSAVDVLVVMFNSLSEQEQDKVCERLTELRVRKLAGSENWMAQYIRSMRRVAQYVGHVPSVDEYKQASEELRAAGEGVETFSRVYAFFKSWPRAREALSLSETNTAQRIDARFRYRKVGKVRRYTDDVLRETLVHCVEHYKRPPLVAELEWWRDRELELARAAGNEDLHLPSASPYRRRRGSWESALLHFGFTLEEVELPAKEYELLRTLAREPTRVFTREELLRNVWGYHTPSRTVDSHACRLRQKLSAHHERLIINVWGISRPKGQSTTRRLSSSSAQSPRFPD